MPENLSDQKGKIMSEFNKTDTTDIFTLGGREFSSRFILGSGKYSMELIRAAGETPYVIGSVEEGEKGVTLC